MKLPSSYSALALTVAIIVFSGVGVLSVVSLRRQSADAEWVEHTHEVLEQLETLLRYATDARRNAIGYVVSGDVRRLQSCFDAQREARIILARLAELTRDNPGQQRHIPELESALSGEQSGFNAVIASRPRDMNGAIALIQGSEWIGRFKAMQSLIDAMKAEEQRLLRLRNGREEVSRRRALTIVVAGDLVAFTLMAAAFVVSAGQSRHRRDAEQQLAHANSQLIERVAELQQRSSELALLSKLGQLLQSCETLEEAGAVVRSIFPKLLPGTRGVVYTIAASRNLVSPITMWDSGESQVTAFAPSDCWALRGGVLHVTSSASAEVVCKHVAPEPDTTFLCIPLVAYGETLGLLHVRFAGVHEESFHVASAAAEQLSLATANLSMQETLRGQAMRDPLTGIFNRRYMEETLERETHRAVRQKTEIGVLLIDLDKFKQYNDTLGHAAGDELLRSAAAIMLRAVRAEDVVCRYGGDEFVIILPDASTTVVEQRARELADSLANLSRPDSTGARVTASIGAALYPRDGTSGKDLLATADRALYQVKRAGRARIGWVSGAA